MNNKVVQHILIAFVSGTILGLILPLSFSLYLLLMVPIVFRVYRKESNYLNMITYGKLFGVGIGIELGIFIVNPQSKGIPDSLTWVYAIGILLAMIFCIFDLIKIRKGYKGTQESYIK